MSVRNPIVTGEKAQSVTAIARIVMGLCFIYYGISKLWFISGTIAFVGTRLPAPAFVFWLAVAIETGCGLLLILGYATRWIAAWLAFYCCFTAVVFHFVPENRPVLDHFFENFALAGGFLYVMIAGPGAWALDNTPRRS
ncbi:MAG TPA: DoxX family protein [Stellaceae bacterium]|jgi:putative oxidoreductase